MKQLLTSRRTVILLISLLIAAVVVGFIIPQRFITPALQMENWILAHPYLALLTGYVGLDHLFTTWWFTAILLLFTVSLVMSGYDQFRIARSKTFKTAAVQGIPAFRVLQGKEPELFSLLRRRGFILLDQANSLHKFVKYPWGHWGKFLLHGGMVIVIIASLWIVLTQKRASLNLYEGELFSQGDTWTMEQMGLLAHDFRLPMAVRMDRVSPVFWENDDLKALSSRVSFIEPDGRVSERELAINRTHLLHGIKIYQTQEFGSAFFLEFTDTDGKVTGIILPIPRPLRRDLAGYMDYRFDVLPYVLKTKYYADAGKNSMESLNPLLVLRFADGGTQVNELALQPGQSGKLGAYQVRLVSVKRWSGINFVETSGMPAIFFGFFIIILGGALIYFTPSREIVLEKDANAFSLYWRTAGFEECYREELDEIGRELELKGCLLPEEGLV